MIQQQQPTVYIDGSMGEGGGQVLRTALTLAMLKQQTIEIVNIRAKRKNPGLLRQHLTCVRAAKAICNAQVAGDELGSQAIKFSPGQICPGQYHFKIGSAGSTSLVCQTVLLPLAFANSSSTVTFEGGTHNGMSPSLTFLQRSFLPLIQKMGISTQVIVDKLGFYPAGGGKWSLTIEPCKTLLGIELIADAANNSEIPKQGLTISAMISQLPITIAEREIAEMRKLLDLSEECTELVNVPTAGPGNIVNISLSHNYHQSVFEMVGKLGVSAEKVARRTVGRYRQFVQSGAIVEEHLADQLLLPLAIAGSGCFCTTLPSQHTTTNIALIQLFNAGQFVIQSLAENRYRISL